MENDPLVAQMEDFEAKHSDTAVKPKLLFTRSKVFVKATADNKDGMPGFLSVIETTTYEHILSWTPEASIPSLDNDAYVDVSSQGDHDVTLRNIYSLLVYPPRIKDRHGSVVINLIGGESLPAFYFHDDGLASKGKAPANGPPSWGGQEMLQCLEHLVDVVGSAIEPGVYLVNASRDDKVNHGAASPDMRPQTIEHPLQEGSPREAVEDDRLYPSLKEVVPSQQPSDPLSSGSSGSRLYDTATTTAVGPITVEGMRRRRSPSNSNRSRSSSANRQKSASTGGLPMDGAATSSAREGDAHFARSRTPLPFDANIDPLVNTVKELRWNILERFSQVARLSRDAASNILDHPITKQILPPHVQQRIQESEAARRVMDDYDSARVYLAKWAATVADQGDRERRETRELDRLHSGSSPGTHKAHGHNGRRINDHEDEEGPLGAFNVLDLETECSLIHHTRTAPLSPMEWFSFFDEAGRMKVAEAQVRETVFRGGIDHDIRIEVWKFFLGIYPWDSTEAERIVIRATKAEEYYALKREWFDDVAVQDSEAFQEQKLRIEKDVHRTDRTISFFASETLPNPSGDFTGVGSNENLELLKDILLTYNVWAAKPSSNSTAISKVTTTTVTPASSSNAQSPPSKDLRESSSVAESNLLEGYVQGMSDLLAPVFAVMGDEVMGFWAFVGLMERTKRNFYRDQVGMQSQLETLSQLIQVLDPKLYKHLEKCEALNLFFCFRWLLIWFKREFEWVDIMRLWEVLFSDFLSSQFQLFVAMSILDKHRDVMMDHLQGFDEILKYVNDLSMTVDLEETLQDAEILYRRLESLAEKIDAKRGGSPAECSTPEFPAALRSLLNAKTAQ
ncbi:GTPase activating protein [Mortierella alpina]|nr:GTPase activating protein [Mortierella alpina]